MISEPGSISSEIKAPRPKKARKRNHIPQQKKETFPKCSRDVRKVVNSIIYNNDFSGVNNENSSAVILELRRRQSLFQEKSEYSNAELMSDSIESIKKMQIQEEFNKIQADKVETISEQSDFAISVRENLQNDWSDVIRNAEEKRDQELNELAQNFDKQLSEFDKHYEQEPNPRFVKSSPELLNLRHRQKALMLSKNFLQAKAIKNQADELELAEKERQRNNWFNYLDNIRNEIVEKQQKIMTTKQNSWDMQIAHMKKTANKEIGQAKKTENHFVNKYQIATDLSGIKARAPSPQLVKKSQSQRYDKFERPLSERQKTFRQRQIMNLVNYTRISTPRVRRSVR